MKPIWRTLAIPVIAAGVATALVVTTGTRVVPRPIAAPLPVGHLARPVATMALTGSGTGQTLTAQVTPTGLAMAPDWLKPCLGQGIQVQPPNTPYPAPVGIALPNPLDPASWQGFDCHVLDRQLLVPNWIDPDDEYGSILDHVQPQDRDRLAPFLQQLQQQKQRPQPQGQPPQPGGDLLSQLIEALFAWLGQYGWLLVLGLALLGYVIITSVQGQRTDERDENGCDTRVLENELGLLKATGAPETTGVGFDDAKNRYQLSSSGSGRGASMAGDPVRDEDLVAATTERMAQIDPQLIAPPVVGKLQTHVEPKMATYMHNADVAHVCMVINKPEGPCPYGDAPAKGIKGCRDVIPALLGTGRVLDLYWESTPPGLTHQKFEGA